MAQGKFEKVGEWVPENQLLATSMEAITNLGYAKFGTGVFKRGMLVTIKNGIATPYVSTDKIIDVTYTAGESGEDPTVTAQKNRFAIVKDDFTLTSIASGSEELHLVYLTGGFYRDTVKTQTGAGTTISLEHELEMNAEGIWLSDLHL